MNDERQSIPITLEEVSLFPGDWSLEPEEIHLALKHCTFKNKLKILEFGAGEGTVQLIALLEKKNIPYEYHSFENDRDFLQSLVLKVPQVIFHHYFVPGTSISDCGKWMPYVSQVELPELPIFDLIIVDGPHGVSRSCWYTKFKKYSKEGTVILVDDFHHFEEFSQELNKNYNYITIIEYNQNPTWRIVNKGEEKIKHRQLKKTFKIVKLKK